MTEETKEFRAHGTMFGKDFDTDQMGFVKKQSFLALVTFLTYGVWCVGVVTICTLVAASFMRLAAGF